MTSNFDLMKLIADPKIEAILYSIQAVDKTVKEIASELDDKPSRLYYPIQKLLDTGLIQVSEEKQVGNLIEKYYSSRQLFATNEEFMSIEGELARTNSAALLSHMFLTFNKGANLLKADLEDSGETRAMYREATVSLTHSEWLKINEEIEKLISKRSSTDDKTNYTFSILTYETDAKASKPKKA
ncbi:ArsR family transcriptional regulator [Planococcus kocurii]|uniref:ArsR family transcriptional regulator n=1 Tax=Planococcus kocurii TaxID=1374 RepID=UPI003D030FDC